MNRLTLILWLGFSLTAGCSQQDPDILDRIADMQEQGNFAESEKLIEVYLSKKAGIPDSIKKQLWFEVERNRRIINDYRMSESDILTALEKRIVDFDPAELKKWEKEGKFDTLLVNGKKRYANPSVSNLFFRYPELRDRKKNRDTYDATARLMLAQAEKMKKLAANNPDPVRLPRRCRVRQALILDVGVVPEGETVFTWLPYPSIFQTQGDVRLIGTSHPPEWLDHPESRIRSVHFQAPMPAMGNLTFEIEYYYTAYGYYKEVDPDKVIPFSGDEDVYREYTREEKPHEVFSPQMRQLTADIVGDEKNPYLKAKKIYEWIADSISYSYAREYSTLKNISEYCYTNRYGDCGQEAILFITLARIAGVPARWQSGFFTFPNDEGMHDWSEIYILPYGWIPVDTYMGINYTSITEDLTAEQRREMREFYFGNIDNYRLVANKGHNQILYPEKKHYRSETVDFQRGEVEWKKANLYFTEWDWQLTVVEEEY